MFSGLWRYNIPCYLKGGGGGGGAGSVSWPSYLQDIHKCLLDQGIEKADGWENNKTGTSVATAIIEAWDNSPYKDAAGYDPSPELEKMEAQLDAFIAEVKEYDPVAEYNQALANAQAAVEPQLSDEAIEKSVDLFDRNQSKAKQLAISRFASGMADIGAINSSAYVMGLAMLEGEHLAKIAEFNNNLSLQSYKDRLIMTGQTASDMFKYMAYRFDLQKTAIGSVFDTGKMNILAKREFLDQDVDFNVKDSLWNLEILQHGGNAIASIQGGLGSGPSGLVGGPSKTSTGLATASGAMQGAISGAMVTGGSPWGAAIGGIGGAIAGYSSGK